VCVCMCVCVCVCVCTFLSACSRLATSRHMALLQKYRASYAGKEGSDAEL